MGWYILFIDENIGALGSCNSETPAPPPPSEHYQLSFFSIVQPSPQCAVSYFSASLGLVCLAHIIKITRSKIQTSKKSHYRSLTAFSPSPSCSAVSVNSDISLQLLLVRVPNMRYPYKTNDGIRNNRPGIQMLNVFYANCFILRTMLNFLSTSLYIYTGTFNRTECFSRLVDHIFLTGFHCDVRTAFCWKNIWPPSLIKLHLCSTSFKIAKLMEKIVTFPVKQQ